MFALAAGVAVALSWIEPGVKYVAPVVGVLSVTCGGGATVSGTAAETAVKPKLWYAFAVSW
jgi:hypothetical protein